MENQPFKGAPRDVTDQVAAYLGNLTPGVICAVGYVSRRECLSFRHPPIALSAKRTATRRRRWAVRG